MSFTIEKKRGLNVKSKSRIIFDIGFTICMTALVMGFIGIFVEQLKNIFIVGSGFIGIALMVIGRLMKGENE